MRYQSEWPSLKRVQITNAGEGVEKREPSYTVDGDVSWCSHYGKLYGDSSKKLKTELLYDPAIPLLGIYPDKTIIQKIHAGTSLVVQWVRLHAPNTGDPGLIPGRGTRSRMPQQRIPHATTKTRRSQNK